MANTTKSTAKKPNKLMIISLLVLAVAILIPVTLTWFTDDVTGSGQITFGKIEITDLSGYNGTATVEALPGKSFAGTNDCSVTLAANSSPAFIRAKISATFTALAAAKNKTASDGTTVSVPAATINTEMNIFATTLDALLKSKIIKTFSSGYAWTLNVEDNYYYLVVSGTGGTAVPVVVSTAGTTYQFILKDDMVIPTSLTNPEAVVEEKTVKNIQDGEVVNITLKFESVQANYLTGIANPAATTVTAISPFFTVS